MEDRLKQQIEEWQTKWQHLQGLIDDKIKAEDYNGAFRMQTVATTLKGCIKDAYAILEPKNNESKLKNLFISGVTNCAILETMHQQVFTEFHNLRKQKGNTEFIQVNGKEVNEIIRLGKLATKKEHCL